MVASLELFGLKKDLITSLEPFSFSINDSESEDETSDFEEELEIEDLEIEPHAHLKGSPYVYYSSSHIDKSQVLAVYKRWFNLDQLQEAPVEALEQLDPQGKSLVMLIGGGHFAAAIIQHKPKSLVPDKLNPFANIVVLEHKSFHRYTTRRKQGGAQSANDNANGKANSAGSNIRRHNEAMLRHEVQELLESWAPHIKGCQRIFYHASGRSNRGIVTGWSPKCPIPSGDPRLRTIPLSTRRPTADEVKRCWKELTRVRIMDAPEMEVDASKEPKKNIDTAPQEATIPPPPELSTEEKWEQSVVNSIKKSSLPELKSLFSTEDLNAPLSGITTTPLFYAARTGKHQVVAALLRWGADPRAAVGAKTLGEVSRAHPKVVATLQSVRKELGEDKWNWNKAGVGAPMSLEELSAREEEERQKTADARIEALKQEEKQAKEQQIEKLIKKHGTGKNLGGTKAQTAGLSEEEKRHIERERRARAAEARMRG